MPQAAMLYARHHVFKSKSHRYWGVSMPQAAMLYARLLNRLVVKKKTLGFNAASGNAIRATSAVHFTPFSSFSFNAASGNAIRATLSLAARVITGLRQRFSQPSRFFLEMGAFFVDTVFSKSLKTSCHPLISKGSSCPRFFVATSPVFRGKNEKIFLLPVYHFPVAACNSFCKFSRAFIVY